MNILSHWQRSSYPPLSRNRQYTANCVGVRPTIHHLVQIKLISTNLKYLTYDTKENKRKTTPPTPTPEKIRGSWYFFSRGGCPLWEIGKEVRGLFLLRAFIWRGWGEALPPQICVTNLFRLILKTGHACRGFHSTCTWASSENSSRNSNVLYKAWNRGGGFIIVHTECNIIIMFWREKRQHYFFQKGPHFQELESWTEPKFLHQAYSCLLRN